MFPRVGAEREQIERSLKKVFASPLFLKADQRKRLLRYLVDSALSGVKEFKEHTIGLEVFERPPNYNPRIDPIVRVQMGQLRLALQKYFEGPGSEDAVRISIPDLEYLPVFETLREEAPVVETPKPRRKRRRKARITKRLIAGAVAALFVLIVGDYLVWRLIRPPKIDAIAVLPFENLTGNSANEYLANGLAGQLTDELARVPDLRVIAWTSAFQFKGKRADIREIGRQLNVDTVVKGSLRKNGGGYRLTVEMDRVSDGSKTLSKSFDGKTTELARLAHDMTVPVLAAVRSELAIPERHKPNSEAYDLYLKSAIYASRITPELYQQSITDLSQAISRDPQFADAYAALAETYVSYAVNASASPLEFVVPAKAAARKALELDPGSARALAAVGFEDAIVLLEWKRGEQELRQAVRLAPGRAKNHNWLGVVLMAESQFQESLAELRKCQELEPLSFAAALARGLYMARYYDESIAVCKKWLQGRPDQQTAQLMIGLALEGKGDFAGARSAYEQFHKKLPGSQLYQYSMVHLLARTGHAKEAREMLTQLEQSQAGGEKASAMDEAIAYAALGDRDQAFAWLDRAFLTGDAWSLKIEPLLDPLRSDTRFAARLKKAGLT